ncbi:MAG: ribonuclease E inhibitor RraB [Planctomycetota bacterium]
MQRHNRNPKLKVLVVPKIGHFGVLAPASGYLARVLGRAKEGVVEIEEAPILKACLAERVIQLDASVIRALARYRRNSLRINVRRKIVFSFSASTKAAFEAIKMRAEKAGYKLEEAEASENSDGEKSWSLEFSRRVRLDHLKEFLKAVATADAFAPTLDASFEGFEVVE